ncbi:1-acyl-sn-glycerol-3-phosphate acyltransferase [Emticicia sp. C21]|uniref:lysophospholipid acyltransferase family protein n=1 Tax=Emticicia sp. C21 TaxID=2302915 RepID=UPI000E34065E|nr:lysophospholipid acyltransferase family protein [Emticicia sp. C21]RFS16042.1 1-acyl-sn-glycerol-3-phosphate acyltransferase [Emticicia sp. C21]
MKKILDYVLSVIYLLYFGLLLIVFHVIQVIAFNVFGKKAHKKSVDLFNLALNTSYYVTGTSVRFKQLEEYPTDRPIIFIANHQSTFDIPGIIWYLRKHQPIFVSKQELAHGIPAISYNLRISGAALIDRKDGKQAVSEILRLSKYIHENNFSAVIFPEGTRSKTDEMKQFAEGGISALLKRAPNALVVPIAIQGTRRFNPTNGMFPLTSFSKLSWTALKGIEPKGKTTKEVADEARAAIQAVLDGNKG